LAADCHFDKNKTITAGSTDFAGCDIRDVIRRDGLHQIFSCANSPWIPQIAPECLCQRRKRNWLFTPWRLPHGNAMKTGPTAESAACVGKRR
jgi:hypothetical protein